MDKKPNFLRKLAAVSTAALIIGGGASSAFAAAVRTATADNATFNTAANWNPAGAVVNGDSVLFDPGVPALTIVGDINRTVTINNNGAAAPTKLQVGNNIVGVAGVVDAKQLTIEATNNAAIIVLGLNGVAPANFATAVEVSDYSGLNTIDFANKAATVTAATDNMNLAAALTSTGGNNGSLVIDANNVTISGAFSNGANTQVATLTVNDGKSGIINTGLILSGAVTLNSAGAGNAGGILTIQDGKNVNVADIVGDAANSGTLTFAGASTVANGIGNGNTLNTLNIGGVVEFQGAVNAVVKATNINLTSANSTLRLTTNAQAVNNGVANSAILNTSGFDAKGNIAVSGADHAITATFGVNGARLGQIQFETDNKLTINALNANANTGFYVADVNGAGAAQGTLELHGNLDLYGSIGATKAIKLLDIVDNAAAAGATVTLKTGNAITAQTVRLATAGISNTLSLEDNTTVNAAIVNTGGVGKGVITALGNATINDDISSGAGNNAIQAINVADAADKALTFSGANLNAVNINYGANNGGTFTLTTPAGGNGNNITITSNLALVADGTKGVFDASALTNAQTLNVAGNIGTIVGGAATRSLAEFKTGNAKLVNLQGGDSAIQKLTMGAGTVALQHDNYFIGSTENAAGQGTIFINQINLANANKTTLLGGTNLGAVETPLTALKFAAPTNNEADVTLNIQGNNGNGVNIYASAFQNTTKNTGSFAFSGGGTSVLSGGNTDAANAGQIGTAQSPFNGVLVTGNTTAVIEGIAYFNQATKIENGSTLQIASNYQTLNIATNAAAAGGIIEFINEDDITVTLTQQLAAVDADKRLTAIKLSGSGNVQLVENPVDAGVAGSSISTSLIDFNGAEAATAQLTLPTGVSLNGININSSAGNAGDTPPGVVVNGVDSIITLGSAIGSNGNTVNLVLATDNEITVVEGTNFFAGITTLNNGQGTVILSAANNGQVHGLGSITSYDINANRVTAGRALSEVDVKTNTTNFGDTNVNDLTIYDGVTYTAGGLLNAGNLLVGNSTGNGNLVLLNGVTITSDTAITPKANNQGRVEFQGNATISSDLGNAKKSFNTVVFTNVNNPEVNLDANIYSQNIAFGNSVINVGGNVTLSGSSAINNVIDLGSNSLTFANGNSTWGSDTSLTTTLDSSGNLGNVKLVASQVTTTANVPATVTVNDELSLGQGSKDYLLISGGSNLKTANGTSVTLANGDALNKDAVVSNKHYFVSYNIVQDAAKDFYLQRKVVADADEIIELEELEEENSEFKDFLENNPEIKTPFNAIINAKDGDALKVLDNLSEAASAKIVVQALDALDAQVDTATGEVTQHIARDVAFMGGNRVQNVRYNVLIPGSREAELAAPERGAVSSGDEAHDNVAYGTWAKPFYSEAVQKNKTNIVGYKAKTTGGVFGLDTMANDNLMIGAAVGITKTDVKYKDNLGNKSKINGFVFSPYFAQQLVDNFFVQGGASFAVNQVKNKLTRYMVGTNGQPVREVANGSYDNMTFGGNLMVGYDAKLIDGVLFTPMAGIGYTKSADESYKETGTTFQNKSYNSKFTDRTDATVGARVIGDTLSISQFAVYPEAHAFVNHKVAGKNAKVQSRLSGQDAPFIAQNKSTKTSYNLGLSVTARPGPKMEYGIGYDANIASKYVAHQGTLKVRVNF